VIVRLFGAAVLVLAVLPLAAQEFEIFDPNDFIDPRERGAIFTPDGFHMEKPGDLFSVIRGYVGRITDYQWRETPADTDVTFAHVVYGRYQANHQLNVKLTAFLVDGRAAVPRYRATVQFARYFAIPVKNRSVGPKDAVRFGGRLLFSGALEENPLRRIPGSGSRRMFDHEAGIELDTYVRVSGHLHRRWRDLSALGSFVWARRSIENHRFADRFIYFYRGPELMMIRDFVRLSPNVGGGAEHASGHWHGAVRGVFNVAVTIPHFEGSLNFAYAPTYLPGRDGKRTYKEFGIYLDRTLMAHVLSRP
jgi:hypothetical protein